MTNRFVSLLVTCALLPSAAPAISDRRQLYTFHHENVLGTSLKLKLLAESPENAEAAEAAALAEIDRLAGILSAWNPASEFSRWTRTAGMPVAVSPELFEVLSLFDQWRDRTGGALDPSAEAVTRIWKTATRAGRVPSAEELAATVQSIAQRHWTLDAANRTATHLTETPLALASFTKSYIADSAARAALEAGASAAVVNAGGDVVVRGDWSEMVDVENPRGGDPLARLLVTDRAIATSGDYHRGFDIGGRHYSHIVDPRTAMPASEVISATVVARDAATAGALATAFSVMGVERSRALAASMHDVEFLLARNDGSRLTSPGWSTLLADPSPARAPAATGVFAAARVPVLTAFAAAKGAPAGNTPTTVPAWELAVQFELSRIDDQRYRRPYVAVWIEDQDRFPVRTLALWYEKPRWLPDLKSWYRGDRLRALAEGTDLTPSLSSATRPPGKYTLKWDGKDHNGQPVKPGKYTVFIEAAREHGTYQLIRQELEIGGVPKQIQLQGNEEIAAASLDYREITNR